MELRQRALKAMEDLLSVQWRAPRNISYRKNGCVGAKLFHYETDKIYAGIPYTNGDMGLMQFLEYYDEESGMLKFDGTNEEFNQQLGGTCACGVMWSWCTVCHSLTGEFVNYDMVKKYGCIPVGSYEYDYSIDSFRELQTKDIMEKHGKDVMFDAYAHVLPADAVESSNNNHTMMCLSPAHTVYTEDGKIDGEESYIIIRDQRGGYKKDFYEVEEDGETVHYSGRTAFKYSFNRLWDEWYLPVTTAEFLGTEPYQPAEVALDCEVKSLADLQNASVRCNYPMAVVKVIAADADGAESRIAMRTIRKKEVRSGLARNCPISELHLEVPGWAKKIRLEVVATTGEVFTPVQLDV